MMNIPAIMATKRVKVRPFYPIPMNGSDLREVFMEDELVSLQSRYLSIYQPVEDVGKEDFVGRVVLTESAESEILEMMENMGQPSCLIEEPLDDGTIQYTHVNLQWKVR